MNFPAKVPKKTSLRESEGVGVNAQILNPMNVDLIIGFIACGSCFCYGHFHLLSSFPLHLLIKIFVKIKWTIYVKSLTYSSN